MAGMANPSSAKKIGPSSGDRTIAREFKDPPCLLALRKLDKPHKVGDFSREKLREIADATGNFHEFLFCMRGLCDDRILKKQDLAKAVFGTTERRSTISRWELGKELPISKYFHKLEEALFYSPEPTEQQLSDRAKFESLWISNKLLVAESKRHDPREYGNNLPGLPPAVWRATIDRFLDPKEWEKKPNKPAWGHLVPTIETRGDYIRACRNLAGTSRKKLGDMALYDANYILWLENGTREDLNKEAPVWDDMCKALEKLQKKAVARGEPEFFDQEKFLGLRTYYRRSFSERVLDGKPNIIDGFGRGGR